MKNIVLLLTFLATNTLLAQPYQFEKLDKYLDKLSDNEKFMANVAVSKDGEIIYQKAIGYADVEQQIAADIQTIYKIGSISKTFTATMVLKAVEENKLQLSQPLADFFPDIENAKQITIKDLLNHQSGIFNFTNDSTYFDWNTQWHSQDDMMRRIKKNKNVFAPKETSQYSNSNYILLTFILEKTYQQSYADLLKNKITSPLQLSNTYIDDKIEAEQNEAASYQHVGQWKKELETHPTVTLGAGSIVSTASDLVKFSDALFNGKIISDKSLQQMLTFDREYGLGIFRFPFHEKVCYGHTGGVDGFSSVFSHITEDNLSYAVVSNGSNFNNNDVYIAILSAVYDKEFDLPEFAENYQPTAKNLDQYVGVYATPLAPIKITITTENGVLIAQATSQPSFVLDAVSEHVFKYDMAQLKITFQPEDETMILYQNGEILFKKEVKK